VSTEPLVEPGWVDAELAAEFPELGLACTEVAARPARSPRSVRERLREMSNRFTGGRAVNLRQEPVPWAYRVFFRQVGIDPDDRRTPVEDAALERMKHGGFESRNLLDDALTIAVVETGVPVLAFDAAGVSGPLGLRLSSAQERLGGDGRSMAGGQIVVADAERALAVLFGDMGENCGITPATERMLLAAVVVKGVPQVSVEEALWTVTEVLTGSD
jgi:DNA/RNA-binding domain of Phe-tRNA-synthetase-like protein